ncbi:GAP family protein [Mycolicibacterium cosmeticum]|uniref:GAP family protein n=1 Tax=Mycolicibacterium cosmeticum TaxID=258533 RepID=UPI003204EFE3
MAVLALPIALDPVRLGVNLLLVSRPRPAQNLLVYWIGCVAASVLLLLVPLLVLHNTAMFSSFVHDLANPRTSTSATVRGIEIGVGVLVLLIAALTAVRAVRGRRAATDRAQPSHGTTGSAESPIARLLKRGRDAPADGGSAVQRLLGKIHRAWESGALWVAAVIGFWAGPNPSLVTFSLATILASGAAFGAQLGAAVVFIIVSLAVVEVVLISNLVAPARTQAVLRRVHDWVGGYRRQIVVAILTLVGLAFVAQGTGIL